jgi:hypothetical protein
MMTKEITEATYSNPSIFREVIEGVKVKHDVWSSREEASSYAWLRKRSPWKVWDKDAFDLFIVSTNTILKLD